MRDLLLISLFAFDIKYTMSYSGTNSLSSRVSCGFGSSNKSS